jgi:hypothetical protein
MKRTFLALAIAALFVPVVRQAEAVDVSIDFFYNNLNDGNWMEVADYGYCWQPNVAVSSADWRPYADGYWTYTDVGWTWISYEDFGWATYHYGRWIRLQDQGWVWVPGYEWGPAWVSWRTGGDYVGWAPLPPARESVYEGRPITGQVDIEFDIGPAYYNFVEVRYIGEPVLRRHMVAPSQNITYIHNTVNVTNITYDNSIVYNHGPDYNRLSQYSARPIQRLTLQRETRTDFRGGVQAKEVTKVQGDKLVVAAPMTIQKPAKAVAPKNLKAKIAQAKVERGWSGVADPKAKAELQQKMRTEDAKQVPPPTMQPAQKAAAAGAPGVSPAPTAVGASPAASPVATAPRPAPASPAATPAVSPEKEKQEGRKGEQPGRARTISPPITPAPEQAQPSPAERGKGRKGKEDQQAAPTPIDRPSGEVTPRAGAERPPVPAEEDKARRGRRDEEPPKPDKPSAMEQDQPGVTPEAPQPRPQQRNGRGRDETMPTPGERREGLGETGQDRRPPGRELAPTAPTTDVERPRGRGPAEDRVEGQPRSERAPSGEGQGRGKKGDERKKEAEPSPTP